jgi:drug/metabolite transporter (DMT)-like permease
MLAFSALQLMPASTYSLLFYTYPAVIVVMSLFLGERLVGRGWLALALTLAGTILTAPNFQSGLANIDPKGAVFTLLNAIAYSFYVVWSGRLLRDKGASLQASAWIITGTLLALIAIVLFSGVRLPASAESWLLICIIGLAGTVLPLATLFAGLERIGAAKSAILSTVEPICTLLLALILLGEAMQPLQWIGGSLILVSVILLQTVPGVDKRKDSRQLRYAVEEKQL